MTHLLVTDRDGGQHDYVSLIDVPIMHTLRDHDEVAAICGGMLACATCHIYVEEPWWSRLPPAQPDEAALLTTLLHFDAQRSRLSCQIKNIGAFDQFALTIAPED